MLNRRPLDRVPVHGLATGFATVHCGLSIADAYNNPEKFFYAVNKTADDFGWQDIPHIGYGAIGAWEFGGTIKWPGGEYAQAPTVVARPVNCEKDVYSLEVPDVRNAGIVPLMMKVAQLQADSGFPLIGAHIMGPWSLASNICGPQTMLKWTIRKPELVHRIQEKTLVFSIGLLRYFVDTFGADRLLPWIGGTAAASNQLISPHTFQEFYMPYMKELYQAAHKMGIKHMCCHICGEQNANLPYFAELDFGDPGILSFGAEVDLEKAAEFFPDDIIMGNISPASLQSDSAEQVYVMATENIAKGKKCSGGFMLAPGCELPPLSQDRNLWAIMKAVSDYGWYGN